MKKTFKLAYGNLNFFPYQSLREYKTSGKKYLAIIAYAMKKVGIGQVQETCVEAKDLNILFFLPKYS